MKPLFLPLFLLFLLSCKPEVPITKKPILNTNLTKTETILASSEKIINISLSNQTGEITVKNGKEVAAKYQKRKWREWCVLSHKEKNNKLMVKVENTSITGEGGCELIWTLTIPKDGHLSINQAAGSLSGNGLVKSLKVQLAAGNLTWSQGNMPLQIQVAAGSVNLKTMGFPNEGSSSIEVGTGQVKITSPKGTSVTTITEKALGQVSNDFQVKGLGHLLKIQVAVGQVSHTQK